MDNALSSLAQELRNASSPEEVFGGQHLPRKEQMKAVRMAYHRLARLTHPDSFYTPDEKDLAGKAFRMLAERYAQARDRIAAGVYGQPASTAREVILKTDRREYHVDVEYRLEGIYNAYDCRYRRLGRQCPATLKVVRDPQDNDQARNEIRTLRELRSGRPGRKYSPYLPHVLEAFAYGKGGGSRQALVLVAKPGWYSLDEVRAAYPIGIDPRDMAWIWRRLLVILGYAHVRGFLHLAVLPANIWIQPELHGLQLRDWTRALNLRVDPYRPLGKVDPAVQGWYPEETGVSPSTRMDIVMAAKCMQFLLGGDALRDTYPTSIPRPITAFLRGSMLPGRGAPDDAWKLKVEFDELLAALWGERVFHPFTMPTQPKTKEVHHG